MAEPAYADPLPPSSSSSGVGLREENAEESNVNLVSSATLYDKGMSLHSFAVESEIFNEKAPLSTQTFMQFHCEPSPKRERVLGVSNFSTMVPQSCKKTSLVSITFIHEILPFKAELSKNSRTIVDIPSEVKNLESQATNTINRNSFLRAQTIEHLTLTSSIVMSMATFTQQIMPEEKLVEPPGSLKKLENRMTSLQNVFKNVTICRELNVFDRSGSIEIKQYIENSGTQTFEFRSQNTDYSVVKVESLITECEYVWATVEMIRLYPFYYEFLRRCYADGNVEREGNLRHLVPKQESFKRAVIHARGCNETQLEAINSLLLAFFNENNECFCLE